MMFAKKTAGIALAASLAVVGPVGAALVATAPVALAQAQVNTAAQTKLTVQKYRGEVGDTSTPMSGVTFKVERIATAPLDTAKGWQDVAAAAEKNVFELTPEGTATEVATNEQGQAVFDNLGVGLFRVTELRAPEANHSVATPFLVTLPFFEDGAVKYERTISPKNQELQPKKSVINSNATKGDNIRYQVDAPIPAFGPNPAGDKLRIEDTLEAPLQVLDQNAANLTMQVLTSADDQNPTALEAADYTVTTDTATNKLTVTLTEGGLTKLRGQRATNPGLTVRLQFDAKLTAVPEDGTVDNTAQVFYNNDPASIPTKPGDNPDDPATTVHFANVAVTKLLNGQPTHEGATGAGAEFQIFSCTQTDGAWQVADGADPQRVVNGQGEVVTTIVAADTGNGNGAVATATGLNRQKENGTFASYCAVETKGVSGYLNNPEPQPLTFNDTNRTLEGSVNNVKDNLTGLLPATGERTMLIILALGVVLFGAGATYQLRKRA